VKHTEEGTKRHKKIVEPASTLTKERGTRQKIVLCLTTVENCPGSPERWMDEPGTTHKKETKVGGKRLWKSTRGVQWDHWAPTERRKNLNGGQ